MIANSARLPGAIIHGKEYPRSINDAAGVLFLDTKGEETGGLALSKLRDNNVATLTLDYTYQLTDGIRIALADENQKAQLVISDPDGRPRIRIGVDKGGEPSIVMLSPEGKEIYRAAK